MKLFVVAKLASSALMPAVLKLPVMVRSAPVGVGVSGMMTTELAGSSFAKEPEMLEAQGINVLHYLMLPRCIGMALSVVTLSVLLVLMGA